MQKQKQKFIQKLQSPTSNQMINNYGSVNNINMSHFNNINQQNFNNFNTNNLMTSELPSFINRKVKNLKPYTNHFKKYNGRKSDKGQKDDSNINSNNNKNVYKFTLPQTLGYCQSNINVQKSSNNIIKINSHNTNTYNFQNIHTSHSSNSNCNNNSNNTNTNNTNLTSPSQYNKQKSKNIQTIFINKKQLQQHNHNNRNFRKSNIQSADNYKNKNNKNNLKNSSSKLELSQGIRNNNNHNNNNHTRVNYNNYNHTYGQKLSQISVYEQFIQRTNSAFSSFFQQFKNSGFKYKAKIVGGMSACPLDKDKQKQRQHNNNTNAFKSTFTSKYTLCCEDNNNNNNNNKNNINNIINLNNINNNHDNLPKYRRSLQINQHYNNYNNKNIFISHNQNHLTPKTSGIKSVNQFVLALNQYHHKQDKLSEKQQEQHLKINKIDFRVINKANHKKENMNQINQDLNNQIDSMSMPISNKFINKNKDEGLLNELDSAKTVNINNENCQNCQNIEKSYRNSINNNNNNYNNYDQIIDDTSNSPQNSLKPQIKNNQVRAKVSPDKTRGQRQQKQSYQQQQNIKNKKSESQTNYNFKQLKKNISYDTPISIKNRNNNNINNTNGCSGLMNVNTNNIAFQPSTIANQQLISSIPLPSNITACSYIIYQPSFSHNIKIKNLTNNLINNNNFNNNNNNNNNLNFPILQPDLPNSNKLHNNIKIITSFNSKIVVQIASLTKIMTFILILQISSKMNLNLSQQKLKIGKFESNINGTSANLQENQIYTIEQLCYGLMLPSGNDASLGLAVWGGKRLLIKEMKEKEIKDQKGNNIINNNINNINSNNSSNSNNSNNNNSKQIKKFVFKKRKCYQRFILQMNKKARQLGMSKTNYANSHGLSNNLNKSCAFDLAILCEYVMKNQQFRKVVQTKEYRGIIQVEIENVVQEKQQIQGKIIKTNKNNESKNKIDKKQQQQDDYNNNQQQQQQQTDYVQHRNQQFDYESAEQLSQDRQAQQLKLTQKTNNTSTMKSLLSNSQNSTINININTTPSSNLKHSYITKQIYWQNTHKLLHCKQQYIGIKTGITNTAGACLASCIKTIENRHFIIIVLGSKKANLRFKETEILKKWLYKKQRLIKPEKQKKIEEKCQIVIDGQGENELIYNNNTGEEIQVDNKQE